MADRRGRIAIVSMALLAISVISAAETTGPPMAVYTLGLLRRGPAWTPERTARTDSLQRGHMANIERMAAEGMLLGAGPFRSGGDLRGVFIFGGDSVAALRMQAERDPAIQAGRLHLALYLWSAPAGIGQPYRRMAGEPGFRDSMITLQLALLWPGPRSRARETAATRRLHEAHLAYERDRLASGDYASAGLVDGSGELVGIVVVRGDSVTARGIVDRDPMVKAGRLAATVIPWMVAYGVMPGDTL